jgi:hypothetical protein
LDKSLTIKLKWNAQGKGLLLIGFLFYRSHVLVGRSGYRIVVVLPRGALEWVTWSYHLERAQTLAYLE